MIEFIAKYWLEVAFGLVCATVAWIARHYVQLIKKEKVNHEKEIIGTIKTELEGHKTAMKSQMEECSNNLLHIVEQKNDELLKADAIIHDEIDNLRGGVLSMQGKNFKDDCHKVLQDDHIIDLQEYETLLADHIVYNKLGGNHEGDALFAMVEAKYKNTIGKNKGID